MKNYLLLFRTEAGALANRTPQQTQAAMQPWMDWMEKLTSTGSLVERGNRLDFDGKVLKPGNVVTNGPYTEIKETLGGYTVIKAENYDAAVELAKGCPILNMGGNVEVRQVAEM